MPVINLLLSSTKFTLNCLFYENEYVPLVFPLLDGTMLSFVRKGHWTDNTRGRVFFLVLVCSLSRFLQNVGLQYMVANSTQWLVSSRIPPTSASFVAECLWWEASQEQLHQLLREKMFRKSQRIELPQQGTRMTSPRFRELQPCLPQQGPEDLFAGFSVSSTGSGCSLYVLFQTHICWVLFFTNHSLVTPVSCYNLL